MPNTNQTDQIPSGITAVSAQDLRPEYRQVWTVHVNGSAVYHGVNPVDALETIIARSGQGKRIEVQRNAQVIDAVCPVCGKWYALGYKQHPHDVRSAG